MRWVTVRGSIRLDRFLKWAGVASTGGQGKVMIRSGMVRVNGVPVVNRGKSLGDGDVVSVEGFGDYLVACAGEESAAGGRQ